MNRSVYKMSSSSAARHIPEINQAAPAAVARGRSEGCHHPCLQGDGVRRRWLRGNACVGCGHGL